MGNIGSWVAGTSGSINIYKEDINKITNDYIILNMEIDKLYST